MAKSFFIVVSPQWLARPTNRKQQSRGRVALGALDAPLGDKCSVFVRQREVGGRLSTEEDDSYVSLFGGEVFLHAPAILRSIAERDDGASYLALYFEGTRAVCRCLVQWWTEDAFHSIDAGMDLRLGAFDLPPVSTTLVESAHVVKALRNFAEQRDSELFAMQAARFLEGPHVLERLFDHLMELRAAKAPNFITVTKGISDHLRDILEGSRSHIRLATVNHSHTELWAELQGVPVSFVDGGVARLAEFPGVEQFAMRVGTYRAIPGELDPLAREEFGMLSRVLADVVDMSSAEGEQPDRKRLQEAIRYVLEGLALGRELERRDAPRLAFLHGPLINQFVTYDELPPYNLPDLLPEFLSQFGLVETLVCSEIDSLPPRHDESRHWNQWIPIYAVVIRRIFDSPTPAVGVVERSVGTPVTRALLATLSSHGVIKQARATKILEIVREYGISDDLLFGCILKQGQYLAPPITVAKNPVNRAHPRWAPVVKQYKSPRVTVMKPQDGTFPLRLEMNSSAADQVAMAVSAAYHTSRLLPRYAFPVGLDIVDKYAKIPDWMSRAVSTAGAAALLRKALEHDDDPAFLAQVRRALAGQPRDFFYRPSVQ